MLLSNRNSGITFCGFLVCLMLCGLWAGSVSAAQLPAELAGAKHALYRGDYHKAALAAEAYVKAHPKSAKGFSLLARAEIAQGHYQRGFDELTRAVQIDPRDTDVLFYLSQVSTIMAQLQFRQLQQMAPNSVRVHQLLAESYRARGMKSQAAEEYKAALSLRPHSIRLLEALGDLERSQFQFKQAATYYSRALHVNPRSYTSAYGMGVCSLFLQEPEKAIPYFRKAIEIAPESAVAHFGLGEAFLRTGKTQMAVTELNKAVHYEPRMRQAYTLLARAYRKLGMTAEAQKALAESQRLARESMQPRQGLVEYGEQKQPTAK